MCIMIILKLHGLILHISQQGFASAWRILNASLIQLISVCSDSAVDSGLHDCVWLVKCDCSYIQFTAEIFVRDCYCD